MGKGYLLDTNIVIYYLEGLLTPAGKDLVQKMVFEGARISVIPKIELLGWKPPEGSKIDPINRFLQSTIIYELDEAVANYTITLRRAYRKIKLPDAIIAATCLCYNLTLITRNTADFSSINQLSTLLNSKCQA